MKIEKLVQEETSIREQDKKGLRGVEEITGPNVILYPGKIMPEVIYYPYEGGMQEIYLQ